jgi:membrane-associated phospholipid phosphatase
MNFNLDKYKNIPYNDNLNYQRAELVYLKSLPQDVNWANKGDNITQYYFDFLRSKNIKVTVEFQNEILIMSKMIVKPIMIIKNYYNRIRPYQLAKKLNIDYKYIPLNSAKTPAYPSGHSTQAVFLSKIITDYYPQLENELKYVANDICFSRLVAGVHFPSDDVFGRYLGTEFYNQIMKHNNLSKVKSKK